MNEWQIRQKSVDEQHAIYKKKIKRLIISSLITDILIVVAMVLFLYFLEQYLGNRWIEFIIIMSTGFVLHIISLYFYKIKPYLRIIRGLEQINPELKKHHRDEP